MQDESKDCGAACLLTIIKTYGGDVSMEYLRSLTNTTRNGTNAYYLTECAKSIGFSTRVVEADIKNISIDFLPCIAHVIIDSKYKHFVVIHEINKNYIVISDPAVGIKKYTFDEFNSISTNKYILLNPNKSIPILKNESEFKKLYLNILNKNKKIIFSVICFSFIYTLINIITSYSFQIIIEDVINISSIKNLVFISTIIMILMVLKHLLHFLRLKMLNYLNCKLDYIITTNVFNHIISLPYQYYKNKSTGDVLSRINDLSSIKDSVSNFLLYLFVDCILSIFIIFFLVKLNIHLSLISIFIIIIYVFVVKLYNYLLEEKIQLSKKITSDVNTSIVESLQFVDTIKGLHLEEYVKNKFSNVYLKYLRVLRRFNDIYNSETFIKNIIDGIGTNGVLILGSIFVLKDKMTVGELITYNALIVYFLEPIKNIINYSINIKEVKTSIRRIIDLYSINEEKLELDNKYLGLPVIGDILINKINYSYNGRNKILNNVSLKIPYGQKVLICGESGSGKSTLMKIIMKYFSIDNGTIKINNKDLNDYNSLEIRRDICYISQDEKLLTDSIYNNIVLDREVSYDDFLKISNIFKVDKIVDDNILKYNMLIEENGFNISGGERQKIILARGILKKSNIYILDESLSQIDINCEREILSELFNLLKDKTIIIISHRFNNNDLFDKAYTIKEGQIYEGLSI